MPIPNQPADRNLSTEHQHSGDAKRPSDTLDRPAEDVHDAVEFDPNADVGKPEPSSHSND